MDNLKAMLASLSGRSRMAIGVATLLMFVAMVFMGRGGSSGPMSLLYSGLDSRASGEVIASLDAQGVPYEIRGNAIYVSASARDRLRMTLAGEGLPAMGEKGYELLDSLSGFGTTSQMFDAAYWRAKEGELARTIVSAPHIRTARVHISAPSNRPFQAENLASAAVTVNAVGGTLDADHARALRYLVAASVAGMRPQDVSVIDEVGGLIASGDDALSGAGEDPRSDMLKAKVERLLEPRVGYGNAVVEVSLELVTESEQITERRFDPESRVAISNENEERSKTSESSVEGQVTVASNLPEGDAQGGGDGSSSKSTETREITNYEVSETQRQITKGPGDIRRLTVAVLVNEVSQVLPDGTVTSTPRTPEELQTLRHLVSSAVGFDEARGDVITLEAMAFSNITPDGTEAGPAPSVMSRLDLMQLMQLGVFAIVAVILGLFVVRPVLTSGAIALPAGAPSSGPDLELDVDELPALPDMSGESADDGELAMPEFALADPLEFSGFDSLGDDTGDQDPVDRLRDLISERKDETLQVLQSWIDQPDDAQQETA